MSPDDHYDNVRLGMTGRMNSFQGAVLLQKLTVFDNELKERERVAKRYDNELSDYFGKQKILDNCKSAYALYTVHCEDRDELMSYLKENGIPASVSYTAGTYVCNAMLYCVLHALNTKYPNEKIPIFNFIYRKRIWNEKEESYLGWERKRGMLSQFNEYLLRKY